MTKTSLLLGILTMIVVVGGCTSGGTSDTNSPSEEPAQKTTTTTTSKASTTEECQSYEDEMREYLDELHGGEDLDTLTLQEIFYSPVEESCLFLVLTSNPYNMVGYTDRTLYDHFSKRLIVTDIIDDEVSAEEVTMQAKVDAFK